MQTQLSTAEVAPQAKVTFKVTLMMVLCSLVGAATAIAVEADTPGDALPKIVVKYDPQSLATDAGARAVYQRLVKAAEAVCPDPFTGSRLVSNAAEQCRRQAVARAVLQINNPRLVSISGARVKTG